MKTQMPDRVAIAVAQRVLLRSYAEGRKLTDREERHLENCENIIRKWEKE